VLRERRRGEFRAGWRERGCVGSRGDERYTGWGAALVKRGCEASRGDESKQGAVGDPGKVGGQRRDGGKKAGGRGRTGLGGKGVWDSRGDGSGHGGWRKEL